ncbi:MAG TPA: nuclear transport factor 2 family protein [Hyphomonadaceae bacterium]|jgi:ketosteroid isomerase-like protein|nr:nuclear transport factor 2 family protein [Hyphomonadaceae bacterium]
MTQSVGRQFETLAARYAAAWNARDLAAIMDLHHPGGSYQLHDARRETALVHGLDGIRETFAKDLARLTAIHFELLDLHEGAGHVVFRSRLTATTNTGDAIDVNTMDLLTIRDGLVMTKHTFVGGPHAPQPKGSRDV